MDRRETRQAWPYSDPRYPLPSLHYDVNGVSSQKLAGISSGLARLAVEDEPPKRASEIQQTPTYIKQAPTYIKQTPSYTQQTPTYTQQTPTYIQQPRNYTQQQSLNHIQQTPDYTQQTPTYTQQPRNYTQQQTPTYTQQPRNYTQQQFLNHIQQTPDYTQLLQALAHSPGTLRKNAYMLEQLSALDLLRKKRCEQCCRTLPKGSPTELTSSENRNRGIYNIINSSTTYPGNQTRFSRAMSPPPTYDPGELFLSLAPPPPHAKLPLPESTQPILRCKFHDGRVAKKKWTCCNNQIWSRPCTGAAYHKPRKYKDGELEALWRLYPTPPPRPGSQIRVAVAIDCEMGVAESGESELIRVTMVDYFSGAALVDKLVWPDVKMKHYNTAFSGVRRQDMEDAKRQGKCLRGRDGARAAIFNYVGPDTIVIGHAGHQDLTALRWIHPLVVDTLVIELDRRSQQDANSKPPQPTEGGTEVDEKKQGGLSLKVLAKERLGRKIQTKWHDSLEDATATRDLLHWYIVNMP